MDLIFQPPCHNMNMDQQIYINNILFVSFVMMGIKGEKGEEDDGDDDDDDGEN